MSNLNDFLKEINEIDLETIKNMTDDQRKIISDKIHNLRKKNNPYASNIEGVKEEQLMFMFTPVYRDYLVKFIMTSVIGYLNRACDEWKVPDGVPVVPVYDYINNEKLIDSPKPVGNNAVDKDLLDSYKENKEHMKKRIIIKEFLEYLFQYDPDEHVRSAYSPNMKDPERNLIVTPSSRMAVYMENRRINAKKKSNQKRKERSRQFA